MVAVTDALAVAAPIYNLGFVVIAIILFVVLFKTHPKHKKVYLVPWALIFTALLIFVTEELLTIVRQVGLLNIPAHINGYFELVMISLFIYALLLQKEHVGKHFKKGR